MRPDVVIVRPDELWTKSESTRRWMLSLLARRVEEAAELSGAEVTLRTWRGRVFVESEEAERLAPILARIFGVSSTSPAVTVEKDLRSIREAALRISSGFDGSFAVKVKRADKRFPMTSQELSKMLGGMIKAERGLEVDLKDPENLLEVEISDRAYLFTRRYPGPGGLPYGSQGRALVLFSGGIDSPLAAWMIAKRGVSLDFLLISPGFPDVEAKVAKVFRILRDKWFMRGRLYAARVQDLILQISGEVREGLRQVVLRRFMYRIGSEVASRLGAEALVTGESLGQVSSQTLHNLRVVEEAAGLPVLRPLIGMNKSEIVELAKNIGTYEASIEVPEFCSLERHSNASAKIEEVKGEESKIEFDVEKVDLIDISDTELDVMMREGIA